MNRTPSAFPWYLAGIICQVVPFGLNNVLFAWMIVVLLGESGTRLGMAQMASQLPMLGLILFAGVMADRYDRRRIVITVHFLAALPVCVLCAVVASDNLSYMALVIFSLFFGTSMAFLQPARDSLLNQVAGTNLQRAVTISMGTMFVGQILGFSIAGQADRVPLMNLLIVQAGLLVLGSVVSLRLPSSLPERESLEAAREKVERGALGDIKDGLSMMLGSSRMAPVMVLMGAVGLFYSASFFVLNPLVVRDVYGGSAADISLSYICFMIGTIFTMVFLVSIGGVERQGIGLMLALVAGGSALSITALQLPFAGYLVCIGLWGICAGFAMSLGRSIIQESAPDSHRARALSVYSLGSMGGMPIGSVIMGFLADVIGPLNSYLVAASGMAVVVAVTWLFTSFSQVDRLPLGISS